MQDIASSQRIAASTRIDFVKPQDSLPQLAAQPQNALPALI
jgi:hypothetical protein